MRLEIPDAQRGLLAIITETMQPPIEEGRKLPFIFDIDIVQRDVTSQPADDSIWTMLETMREYKNQIFFASMTSKAKELFR